MLVIIPHRCPITCTVTYGNPSPMTQNILLDGVSETMLVTLFYRAMETRSEHPLIEDPKAVEIVESVDYDFSRCNKWTNQACMAVRTRIFQDAIGDFLKEHPHSVVINLAAGLDNRFSELDNGTVRWFDLDLPQVIDVRRRYIEETDRSKFIASDVTALEWIDMLNIEDPSIPVLIVAEGLLPYLEEQQAKTLLSTLATRFPNSRAVFEIFGSFVVGREWVVTEFRDIRPKPKFLWSPHDPSSMETWDKRFKTVAVENLLARYPEQWRFLWHFFKLSSRVRDALGNRIVTLDLNAHES